MGLGKPPIVEIWIEFKFDPGPNQQVGQAIEFLRAYAEEYPELEIAQEDRLQFKEVTPERLPEVVGRTIGVKHLRIHDKDETKWLQVTSRQLVCNFVRLGESYPGFEFIKGIAIEKFARFVDLCKPVGLSYMAIHYVDVIEIPVPVSGELLLSDYFTFGVDLAKEPFGNQLSFALQTAVEPEDRSGRLEIHLQYETLVKEGNVFRFRMDWHKTVPYNGEIDLELIAASLNNAHQSVMKCFRQAFTDRTWAFFDPDN